MKLQCPTLLHHATHVKLAHGSGGRAAQGLLHEVILEVFDDQELAMNHDGSYFTANDCQEFIFTTDSYVVQPIFFPGGDIGKLAVCGTVNDLAMCGAKPSLLSVGLILEEGFSIKDLKSILVSMKETADKIGLRIVTGDTKVVERGKGDQIFINTSGIGRFIGEKRLSPKRIAPGDLIVLSGDIGRHGAAISMSRSELGFESGLTSDCCLLWPAVEELFENQIHPKCLRDVTRGGLGAILNELASSSEKRFTIQEATVPVDPTVHTICEVLGFDPLHLACEGRFVGFFSGEKAQECLKLLTSARSHHAEPVIIGEVLEARAGRVELENAYGSRRVLTVPMGELLPRIC